MSEAESYAPSLDFSTRAQVKTTAEWQELLYRAQSDPDRFWDGVAQSEIHWFQKWTRVLDWNPPAARWFVDAKTNVSFNCLDRHCLDQRKDKVAIVWEGEPGEKRAITYKELLRLVSRFANVLKGRGYKSGDRCVIYMPMIPELPIVMLACSRLGIVHSVVFGGFSAESLKARIEDLGATIVITADGGFRRGREVCLKATVDHALDEFSTVREVIVCRRTGSPVDMVPDRDRWWHELDAALVGRDADTCPAVPVDSEHPLFVLYTSGTTGKPKGILHTTGGYLTQVTATMKWVFDLREDDVYWCTADVGWITGHSYVVYGPLSAGATTVMYEGTPDYPQVDRWWRIVERYRVSIFYTSPTAIRVLSAHGDKWPESHDLASLRLLGSVGEPINPSAWNWFHQVIGKRRCPIVDTWWQTETGAIMIAPLPGVVSLKPGSATFPIPGVVPDVVDQRGTAVPSGKEGLLILRKPWPSMARTIWGDDERFREQYWNRFPGAYFTGDAARCDTDGYYWMLGRVDDVINVSGHRLSTMEVESALVHHPSVAEAAVVGKPHAVTGQAVCCFVMLKGGDHDHDKVRSELRDWISHEIGAFARPQEIRFSDGLPKTRSGKIMRRLLRELATSNTISGDVTTLEDLTVVAKLAAQQDED